MTPSVPNAPEPRRLSVRRMALVTTALAGLGAAALVFAPNLPPNGGYPAALAQNLTEQAHKLQAPTGFADIVEKVKPAVMSVRVKMDQGPQTSGMSSEDLPPGLERFFRQFGMPNMQGGPNGSHGRGVVTGQGS